MTAPIRLHPLDHSRTRELAVRPAARTTRVLQIVEITA